MTNRHWGTKEAPAQWWSMPRGILIPKAMAYGLLDTRGLSGD